MKRAYSRVAPGGSKQPRTIEELLDRVVVTENGCWIWTGADDGYGDHLGRGAYGRILRPDRRVMMPVHKYVVEYIVGIAVPADWHVDHLCCAWHMHDPRLVRRCCNPDHLEPVPGAVNQQRKILRRLGYVVDDDPLADRDFGPDWIVKPDQAPILAPGETDEDLYL
jgi:hypothetical protein